MKNSYFLILIILLATPAAADDKSCLSSTIDNSSKEIKVISAPKIFKKDSLKNIVQFKDGATLTYLQQACEPFLLKYEFHGIKNFPQKLDDNTKELAKAYIGRIPLVKSKAYTDYPPDKLLEAAFSNKAKEDMSQPGMSEKDFSTTIDDNVSVEFKIYEDGFSVGYQLMQ